MSISPGFTNAEIRALVFEFQLQPWGQKKLWLAEQSFSDGTMRRWMKAVFEGELDRGLIPRQGESMTPRRKREVVERSIEALHDAHEVEIETLNSRIRMLEGTNDALGKAIGLLHAMREEEPEGPAPTTTDPTDS